MDWFVPGYFVWGKIIESLGDVAGGSLRASARTDIGAYLTFRVNDHADVRTGLGSSIQRRTSACSERPCWLGYDANMLHAAPYDWRLSPTALEQRDGYFTRLKSGIETMVKLHGIRVALLAGHRTAFPFDRSEQGPVK